MHLRVSFERKQEIYVKMNTFFHKDKKVNIDSLRISQERYNTDIFWKKVFKRDVATCRAGQFNSRKHFCLGENSTERN